MTNATAPSRILPAHIEETIQAIAELHAQHHRRATPMQRVVGQSVHTVGRPRFVGWLTVFIVGWIGINLALSWHHRPFDASPFPLLQDLAALLGLYITILILITQRRDDEIAQHREQLTLELAILGEQKSAKIIQLLEELRRDHPMIRDRIDEEAEALSIPADPQAVLNAIVDTHEEMLSSPETDPEERSSISSPEN